MDYNFNNENHLDKNLDKNLDDRLANIPSEITLTVKCSDSVQVYQSIREKKHLKGENYLRIFVEPLKFMAEDKSLKGTDLRVFLKLIAYVNSENLIQISQSTIGEELNIAQSEVSRSIKKLINKEYLTLESQIGKQNVYRLNPYFGFKTYAKNLEILQDSAKPLRQSLLKV